METPLKGKVALVTGASRGIGEFIAKRLGAAGAAVAVSARTLEEGDHQFAGSVTTTVKAINDGGGIAAAFRADLGDHDDRHALVPAVVKEFGPIDILVNNAAITYFEPIDNFSERHYDLMFDVQVKAPFELCQAVLPSMRERKQGWILNISSGAARHPQGPPYGMGMRGGAVYGMCKAALERFSTGLAAEAYRDNIAVNCLSPSGVIATPGVVHHKLDKLVGEENLEPMERMVDAAYAMVTGDPQVLTGKVTYARPFLEEIAAQS
ncbi:MAG TPA: SDR family NAD(P)-dependent oxidoreductase [Acidimicrobiales bacterium]|nr:SDR family NAD(P)-dependent oxidoreductase [Acidimicrobiales bacterium]